MNKLFLVCLLIFAGCSYRAPYKTSTPYYVVIKNSKIALADTGFIKKDGKRLNLQLFTAGTPVFDLHVKSDVCLDYICMKKENFNREFFGFRHYESFVDELFNFKPIYSKKNLKKTDRGFEQKIVSKSYDITYRVEDGNLYFKDRKNTILIKLKELK